MRTHQPVILMVDDDPVATERMRVTLQANGFENVDVCLDSRLALDTVRRRSVALLLLDLFMPHVSGLEVLEAMIQEFPQIPVIVLTVDDSVDVAVRCMKLGAFDFMTKPVDKNRLISAVNHALRVRDLENRLTVLNAGRDETYPFQADLFAEIITDSPKMHALFEYVEAIAPSPKAVLITGESGTGKELMARAIHRAGGRSGEFVPVNVAGLDDTMFSDTLFGHVRGAFTGADRARAGLVERAADGTLFLDEIGDLEQQSQVKLLRLLQEQEFYPLGSDQPKRARVRIVAATNADLIRAQEEGRFRKDLYYRLVSHLIHMPPLRERPEDIIPLARHFAEELARSMERDVPELTGAVEAILRNYTFPGNVRELQALIADAVSRSKGKVIAVHAVEAYLERRPGGSAAPTPTMGERFSFQGPFPTLSEVEDVLIEEALRRTEGNQSAAARLLGVSQSTLSRRQRRV